MASRLRTAGVLLTSALLAGGCSWGAQEPGLFTTPRPTLSPDASTSAPPVDVPAPTDPRLPVVGEALWTTAEGNDVTIRFAVHAVRRTTGATVLDWSVTPLVGPGRAAGDPVPSGTDLGLDRTLAGQQNLALLDPAASRAYRPLANVSPELFSRCLCTPLFAVLPQLRFGETRLLQLAFPTLPAASDRIDVALPNLAVVPGVAVTPVGQVPVARTPTDLTRPAAAGNSVTGAKLYAVPDGSGDLQTVVVNRVVASKGLTSVVWTFYSVDDQDLRTRAVPPVARALPDGVRVVTEVPASGPRLRVPDSGTAPTGVRWTTATFAGLPTYECLCSGLGLWSRGLRSGGGSAHLTTQVGPLPAGTTHVDVQFPGLDAFTSVRVTWVDDAEVVPTEPGTGATWTYDATDPPRGWATSDWPTPLPAPDQVGDYTSRPERILGSLPRG
ncbi:hypothetical protein [Microlunatus antarcticus]|uniref:Lipoprotein n=1 Tax=Microlunatus antarcticus TaxID=53388 RepID=A0A7W5P672_9ACTN|nr:hypothetical protein [Microlunatus antarcticus]MBB3325521.1 hypothetical protein [Microlunatus antarcticus]